MSRSMFALLASLALAGSSALARQTGSGQLSTDPPNSDCAPSILDQATRGCLTASSTATDGLLFPYPGVDNVFAAPAVVGGGVENVASGLLATVGGGTLNVASERWATVGGGYWNTASDEGATVGGGQRNAATGYWTTIGGGRNNEALSPGSTVAGGSSNDAGGDSYATVGGGRSNKALSEYTTVSGGKHNHALGPQDTVGGGNNNVASGFVTTIGGGQTNKAYGIRATIAGGSDNTAHGSGSTVGGGINNRNNGKNATISGGWFNVILGTDGVDSNDSDTISGGKNNTITGTGFCVVGGGRNNSAEVLSSVVGGGQNNGALERFSVVPGGNRNTAAGEGSFAAGTRAKANHDGSFVWGDTGGNNKTSSAVDQFNVYARGGTRIFSSSLAGSGVLLAPGAGTWTMVSDRAAKENLEPVDCRDVLDRLSSVRVSTWNYRAQDESVRHMSPMAQDFYAAFGLGLGETTVDSIDLDGVALVAIQGLHAENALLRASLETLEAELASLKDTVARIAKTD